MEIKILPLEKEEFIQYKKEMQEAFQAGAIAELGEMTEEMLKEQDIDQSLLTKGAVAYKAVTGTEMVGGAIVVIDEVTHYNHLEFLYVKNGMQGRGIGKAIWDKLEKIHPYTLMWETYTPYFEKRNIHFYINCLGFHAVEFFHPGHKEADQPEDLVGGDCYFRFRKNMK